MSGPFSRSLLRIEGPAVLWESKPMPTPAAGGLVDFGLHVGGNRGWAGAYLKALDADATGGQVKNDMLQYHPCFTQPVGSPGGSITTRINPGRITTRVSQGIYQIRRLGGVYVSAESNPLYGLVYRGIFGAGPGPYRNEIGNLAPAGPILCGETREFSLNAAAGVDVPNPSPIEPFMWTLFGRCLVADIGCVPGEIMAFASARASGTVRGWGTTYSPANSRFSVGEYTAPPFLVGKDGASSTFTDSRWAFFFRFIGTPKGGLMGAVPPMPKRVRITPPLLWMSAPIPMSAGLGPVHFAMPDDFSPALVNAMYLCKTPELGFSTGDWVPVSEGDNNGSQAGYAATFNRRTVTLSPCTSGMAIHSLIDGSNAAMNINAWSWFFVFVG
jgi:hypothetical protein